MRRWQYAAWRYRAVGERPKPVFAGRYFGIAEYKRKAAGLKPRVRRFYFDDFTRRRCFVGLRQQLWQRRQHRLMSD